MRRFSGVLLFAGFFALAGPVSAGMQVFDSAGHEKTGAVRIELAYPSGFAAKEHMDGYVIQEFSRQAGDLEENLLLELFSVAEEDAREAFAIDGAADAERRYLYWKQLLETGGVSKVLSVKDVRAAGRFAVLADLEMPPSAANLMRYMRMQVLCVYGAGEMVKLSCSLSGPKDGQAHISALFARQVEEVCTPVFESLRVTDGARR